MKILKSLYDSISCESLKFQYITKENDIDIKRLVNTINKFSVDMEAAIALIYQIYDGSIARQVKVQKEYSKESYEKTKVHDKKRIMKGLLRKE